MMSRHHRPKKNRRSVFPYRRRRGVREKLRSGQAILELAVSFLVFISAFLCIIDTALLMYHQIMVSQAANRTARFAGTNNFTRTEIQNYFFQSASPSMVSKTDSSITSISITTQPLNAIFTNSMDPNGRPTVLIEVSHRYSFFNYLFAATPYTIRSTGISAIETWQERPLPTF